MCASSASLPIHRIKVDLEEAWDRFLEAQDANLEEIDVYVPGDYYRSHDLFDEQFRWKRCIWRALADHSVRLGLWRFRVTRADYDLEWIEVAGALATVKAMTPEFARAAIDAADWQQMLRGRIRLCRRASDVPPILLRPYLPSRK